ncbi:O-antigen ligase family protein [Patescibacteria group bacterium]|nr:O-antigen ligase family protein [Patescibacteria group bacterium]
MKQMLKTVFFFELIAVLLITAGVLPREFSYFITALILIYFLGAEIIDSLVLTILSIPLFLALPISDSYDAMANWRIILTALFLIWAVRANFFQKKFFSKSSLELWIVVFVLAAFFSLVGSVNAAIGFKKILFLGNIFLLFTITRGIVKNKESFLRILKAGVAAAILTLAIGYAQLISVFFYSLYQFWQFWAENAIYALYGDRLAQLLSYSNTWFSYYSGDIPPTLRMFSVFPDSHSFALFNIILIPLALSLAWHYKTNGKKYNFAACCFLIILMLLAILFSGSRGAWISAITPLIIILFLARRRKINPFEAAANNDLIQNSNTPEGQAYGAGKYQKYKSKTKKLINYLFSKKLGIITTSIILFFALFPASSVILEQSQKAEWRRANAGGEMSSSVVFKRFKSIADLEEISNKGRIKIWKDTLKSIKNYPLLGVGIGNFPVVLGQNVSAAKKGASAHNLFLDIAAETGILGLFAFLAIFYEILKTAFGILKSSQGEFYKFFALSFGVYLFWILGYSLFDVVLFNDKVLMMFVIGVGLLYGIKGIETKATD